MGTVTDVLRSALPATRTLPRSDYEGGGETNWLLVNV